MERPSTPNESRGKGTATARAANVEARRVLLHSLREELLSSVEAVVGYTQMLRNDAADRPQAMLADVEKLLAATTELYDFIKAAVTDAWPELQTAAFDERLRRTRHDIGNRLNHALGYCQFLLLDENERFAGELADDLERVVRFCKNCETILAHHKRLAEGDEAADLPVTESAVMTAALMRAAAPAHAAAPPARILVVDDSPTTRDMLTRFLKREKHTVRAAADGTEALALLAAEDFDLVLLDFMMPGLSGYDVLRHIKGDERLRHTPVIMISALDSVADMVPCIEFGADDYLAKPVDFALLRARVNSSLERMRLREREFAQFFTPEVARHLVRNPDLIREGRDADVTVLFSDVRGFSRITERLKPSETVRWLSDIMAEFSECVRAHRGVLVNFIGDELMAMWGAPEELPNHAELACRAAFDIVARLPELNARWRETVGDLTDVGIGLNSGIAQVGNTGSSVKLVYGPLGNTVNLASRIQGATKHLGTRLLVSGNTHARLQGGVPARRLCQVRVMNIHEPVDLYELLPPDQAGVPNLKERYEHALAHYEQQQFPQAAAVLGNLLVDDPHDGPSLLLMSRVVERLLHPNERFDPVWDLPGK